MSERKAILKYFAYEHLQKPLKDVSKSVAILAIEMDDRLPEGPEKDMGLRKLLEAKDCFVRARLEKCGKAG